MSSFDLHVYFDLFMFNGAHECSVDFDPSLSSECSVHLVLGSYRTLDPQDIPRASMLVCEVACRDIVSQHLAFAHTCALLKRSVPSILYHYDPLVNDLRLINCAIGADKVVNSLKTAFQEAWEIHVDMGTALDINHSDDLVARESGEKFFRSLVAVALIAARVAWNNDLSVVRAAFSKGTIDVGRLKDAEDTFAEALERRGLSAVDAKGWLMPMIADLRLSTPPMCEEYENLIDGLFEM